MCVCDGEMERAFNSIFTYSSALESTRYYWSFGFSCVCLTCLCIKVFKPVKTEPDMCNGKIMRKIRKRTEEQSVLSTVILGSNVLRSRTLSRKLLFFHARAVLGNKLSRILVRAYKYYLQTVSMAYQETPVFMPVRSE